MSASLNMLSTLKCSFGSGPTPAMMVPTGPPVLIGGTLGLTMVSIVMAQNIIPFITCSSPANPAVAAAAGAPMPCTPTLVMPWTPPDPTVLVNGIPMPSEESKSMCAFAGEISVIDTAQVSVMVG